MQCIKSWVNGHVGYPARPFLNCPTEPFQGQLSIAQGFLDHRDFIPEHSFLATQLFEIADHSCPLTLLAR